MLPEQTVQANIEQYRANQQTAEHRAYHIYTRTRRHCVFRRARTLRGKDTGYRRKQHYTACVGFYALGSGGGGFSGRPNGDGDGDGRFLVRCVRRSGCPCMRRGVGACPGVERLRARCRLYTRCGRTRRRLRGSGSHPGRRLDETQWAVFAPRPYKMQMRGMCVLLAGSAQ